MKSKVIKMKKASYQMDIYFYIILRVFFFFSDLYQYIFKPNLLRGNFDKMTDTRDFSHSGESVSFH